MSDTVDEEKAWFAATTHAEVPEHETAQLSAPLARGGVAAAASSDLWQTATAITLGVEQADLDLDRLDRLVPRLDADEPPRQVGVADVDAIESTTDALRRCDYAHGGGLARAAAIAHLRSVLRLRKAAATPAIRVRLDIASADLAMLTAWCSYDVEQHDQARRLWTVALELCRHTEYPCAADLAVNVLLDMAQQSLHLSRPDEALRLAGYGLTVENNSPGAVADVTRSYLASVQSWSYAMLGETIACERAVGRAEQHFAAVDPGTAPSITPSRRSVKLRLGAPTSGCACSTTASRCTRSQTWPTCDTTSRPPAPPRDGPSRHWGAARPS